MRYFMHLAYRGEPFHGWQSQPNAVSVQSTIEEALSTIMRESIRIVGAGRTDAGVNFNPELLGPLQEFVDPSGCGSKDAANGNHPR